MSSKKKITVTKDDDKPELVPKLRFPEFREAKGWEQKTGNRLFDQINDRNPESSLQVLAITQEHGAIPRHMIDYHVSVTEKSIESYKVVQVGDFIISLRSFQGGIEYSQYQGICSPAYVILRRRIEGSDAYFKHYLKTDRFIQILTKNLEGLRDGKMVSYAQFSELFFPVPPPPEQQKIADCLSSVDELISAQARKLDALKTHKKGLMQQLFPREGETQPRLRLPEFSNAPAWQRIRTGALFRERVEKGYPEKTVLSATQEKGVIPYDLLGKSVIRDKQNLVGYKVVREGDFVISLRSFEGGFEYSAYEGIISPAYVILERTEAIDDRFFQKLFKSPPFIIAIQNCLNNNLRDGKSISYKQAGDLIMLIPTSIGEQQRIADCITSLDDLIAAQTQKLETLKTHKKGLMQRLFPSLEGEA
jgi:type I restriction enzyme S subunit